MKKRTTFAALFTSFFIMVSSAGFAQEPQVAYTYNPNPDERVPLYYEPSLDSRLFGEYFNGVEVNVLESISDDWAKIQIVVYPGGEGLQMYTQTKYLVIGDEGEQVEKTTIMYTVNVDTIYLHNSATEMATYSGPLGLNEYVELIGLYVPMAVFSNGEDPVRPLSLELNHAHLKTGNVTGFLDDTSVLTIVEDSLRPLPFE